jgi:hypothetical protein
MKRRVAAEEADDRGQWVFGPFGQKENRTHTNSDLFFNEKWKDLPFLSLPMMRTMGGEDWRLGYGERAKKQSFYLIIITRVRIP